LTVYITQILGSIIASSEESVIFFANGIGDALMVRPTLLAITSCYPQKFVLVTAKDTPTILYHGLSFIRVDFVDVASTPSGKRITTPNWEITNCGLFLSIVPWFNDTLANLLLLYKPQVTVGHFDHFHLKVPYASDRHSIDVTFQFATLLESSARLPEYCHPLLLPPGSADLIHAVRRLVPSGSSLVAVHFETARAKRPSEPWLSELLQICRKALKNSYFVVLTREEKFDWLAGPRTIVLRGAPLYAAMAAVAESDLFIGCDSCMLHAADFSRVPGIAIFTLATLPEEFGYRISTDSICISCQGGEKEIDETVMNQVESYLSTNFGRLRE